MNDIEIEELLRKAPRVNAPAGLHERLQADIRLSRVENHRLERPDSRPFLRRWFPAISFAAFFLACVVVVAVQTNAISQLRQESKTLRVASENLGQLRSENAEYKRLVVENQELERLRKDNLELSRLRAEVEKLRAEKQTLETLRAENQQLLAARNAAQKENTEEDQFAMAKEKAERAACINNLKQIGLAAHLWADENKKNPGKTQGFPSDFISMKHELGTPRILRCPGDKARVAAETWPDFESANVSYEMLSPGVSRMSSDPANVVYVRCPIHNSVVCVDGHAEFLGRNSRVVVKDGKAIIEREAKP